VAAKRPGRVRIVFLISNLEVGGAERQLVRLANGLDPERFEPRIVTMLGGGPLEAEVRPGVPVVHLELMDRVRGRGVGRFPLVLGARLLLRLARHLRAERPDILHGYLPLPYVTGALTGRAIGIPVILAGRRGLTSFHIYPQWRWRILARLANRIIDVHVCNSEAVRAWAIEKEGLPAARTTVIPNGIDLPDGPPPELEPAWRAPVRAAMIANLIGYKDHDTVLRSLAIVRRAHPELRLVLFGEGPERAALERLAAELRLGSGLVFAGRRPDAPRCLPGFDLALLGSAQEGLPNALMEAMAVGLPVVASAVGGVPELVRDGVDGLLVPAGDPAAMAAAIARLVERPGERARMGAAARERIRSEYTTEAMVRRTADLYLGLVGARRGG
jgi:glycosyltransferase involved in cell wall biosynthesis